MSHGRHEADVDTQMSPAVTEPRSLIRMPYQPTQAQWTSGIAFGGTPAGLAAAEADAGQQTLRFLASHLGRGTELSASNTTPDT